MYCDARLDLYVEDVEVALFERQLDPGASLAVTLCNGDSGLGNVVGHVDVSERNSIRLVCLD